LYKGIIARLELPDEVVLDATEEKEAVDEFVPPKDASD